MSSRDEIESIYTRTVMAPHYQMALHKPDPTLGWKGDPDLVLAWRDGIRLEDTHDVVIEECDISGWGRLDADAGALGKGSELWGMNGTIGTRASAGWKPPQYSAAHESAPGPIT